MNSIFDTTGNHEILDRIKKLTPESKAVWGKMTVTQMMQHCSAAIDVAFGEKELKISFLMRTFGKMLKNKVINSNAPLRKNSPTAKEFIFEGDYEFDSSKKELMLKFSRFASKGKASIKTMKHPFWGELTYEEWDKLMYKHLSHHLEQFGV